MIRRQNDAAGDEQPSAALGQDGDLDAPAPPAAAPPLLVEPTREEAEETTPLESAGQTIFQIFVGLLILGAAMAATKFLVDQKTAPAQATRPRAAPVVLVQRASVGTQPTIVSGYGSVRAANETALVPQVGGRVVSVHPGLVAGGTIPAGAVAVEIDPTDYALAVRSAEADVQRATAGLQRIAAQRRSGEAEVARFQTALQTTLAEAEVAQSEYARLNPGRPVPPLVAKEPQMAEARAALAAAEAALDGVDADEAELGASLRQAEAALEQARVNLGRTRLLVPEGRGGYRVLSESANVGQTIAAGQPLAQVYDVASLEVPVPIEDGQLQWIALPSSESEQGSAATIRASYGGSERQWPGRVQRTQGRINPRTRLVELVVGVEAEAASGPDGVPLVPGLFVNVNIEGQPIEGVAAVPRRAIHVGSGPNGADAVYVADDGVLRTVAVEIVRLDGDTAYVRGLRDGENVILSRLDIVTEGMAVQVAENAAAPTTVPSSSPAVAQ